MDLKLIRNTIVRELYKHLNIPVVMVEQIPTKPPYPFVSYKFIIAYNPDKNRGNYSTEFVGSLDERFTWDVEETVELQPTMTLSITVYSGDGLESQELAIKAMEWFKHIGYQDLADINVVVVDTLGFGDRTALIVDNYEYRTGFDVIMRTTDTMVRRYENIEEYNFKEVE